MKVPRDLSGADLVSALAQFGYQPTYRGGSHVRLTTQRGGEHHITIPLHPSLKIGTLNAILKDVAAHAGMDRDECLRRLFS
jgi:predicted RNA binding protein YcfA (HicA-like mRNA interferase family)